MPSHPDRVYKPEHLRFATLDPKRGKPTLYFRTPHGSGRLRQVHKKGPKIQGIVKHTSHAFFPDRDSRKGFGKAVKKGMKSKDGLTRQQFRALRKQFGGRHTPTENAFHFEATFDAHGPGGKAYIRHRSGGQVIGAAELEIQRANVETIYHGMQQAQHR